MTFGKIDVPPVLFTGSAVMPSLTYPSTTGAFGTLPVTGVLFTASSPSMMAPGGALSGLPAFSMATSAFPPGSSPGTMLDASASSMGFYGPYTRSVPGYPPVTTVFDGSSGTILMSGPSERLTGSSASFTTGPSIFTVSTFGSSG